jgi:outer membrane protein assembly factor BamB
MGRVLVAYSFFKIATNIHMKKFLLATSLLLAFLAQIGLFGQKISQWRGPNRDGLYPEKNLLASWPETGPALLWINNELESGYGSPVVYEERIFVNGEVDSTSYLFCFDYNGKLLWKSPFGKEFTGSGFSANFPGNRSTPTVTDGLVYVTSGTGTVACFDAKNGKEKWSIDIIKTFNGLLNEFGYSESLLVNGNLIYCYPGGTESNIVALDRFTGKPVWTSPAIRDTVSHCSPLLINLPTRKVLVSSSIRSLFALDALTGKLLWSQKQDSVQFGLQGNTPIFSNSYLYYLAGDGNGLVKLKLTGDGQIEKEIWRNPSFKNNMGGFVLVNNTIYGTSDNKKMLAFDASTGMLTDSLRLSSGSTIFADGHLYCYTDKGEMCLLRDNKGKLELVSKFKCEKGSKESVAHPVISDGMLLVRHGKSLMAYRIR